MRFTYRNLCILALLFLLAIPVQAGVLISPARLEAIIGVDGRIPPVTLLNRGPEKVAVRFTLVGGGHDLEGMPRFDETSASSALLAERITFAPQECLLQAGEIATVHFQLQQPLQAGLYPALVADIVPLNSTEGGIVAATRIAIPMLLTADAAHLSTQPLRAQALRISQADSGGPLQVEAVVHNLGNQHVYTGGRAVISGAQGEIGTVVMAPVAILPGYARQLTAQWAPTSLPQGQYVVRFVPDAAPHAATQLVMQVVRPYELAAIDVHLEQVQVIHDGPGVVVVQALVANRGNVTGEVQLEMQMLSPDGVIVANSAVVGEVAAESGQLLSSRLQVADMVPGEYLVQAVMQQQGALISTWQQSVVLPATHLVQR